MPGNRRTPPAIARLSSTAVPGEIATCGTRTAGGGRPDSAALATASQFGSAIGEISPASFMRRESLTPQLALGPTRREALGDRSMLRGFRRLARWRQGVLNGQDERFVVQWLAEIIHRACTEALRPGLRLVVAGDYDHRYANAGLQQAALDFEAVHAGHVQIEYHAVRPSRLQRTEEFGRRGKAADIESSRSPEALQRSAHGCIVVDNGNLRSLLVHSAMSIADRAVGCVLDHGLTSARR